MDDKVLEVKVKKLNRELEKINRLRRANNSMSTSQETYRKIENNTRRNLSDEIIFRAIYDRGSALLGDHNFRALQELATSGDPLSENITEYINSNQNEYGSSHFLLAISLSDLPRRLITREISEEEYFGYMNGKIPFAEFEEEKHFLSKN